ncbi:MAG: phosphoribosylglycinamide formyltransferase [Thermaceae bacterium]|nr:phosphoribosylglycinamide formyltransferase [Thermaceae bacterium]
MSHFPLPRPARIAVMASGRGSNLEALLKAFPHDNPLGHIVLVISDQREALALQKAVAAEVEAEYVPWTRSRDQGVAYQTGREQFEQVAGQLLHDHRIDLILLAGFMRLLSPAFVQAWQGRILNIHPSLLPQFPGLHAQRQALEAGVSESGCTVHFVDAGVDTGPIVLQRHVPVLPGDTEETLAARILEQEHQAYPQAVRMLLAGDFR